MRTLGFGAWSSTHDEKGFSFFSPASRRLLSNMISLERASSTGTLPGALGRARCSELSWGRSAERSTSQRRSVPSVSQLKAAFALSKAGTLRPA